MSDEPQEPQSDGNYSLKDLFETMTQPAPEGREGEAKMGFLPVSIDYSSHAGSEIKLVVRCPHDTMMEFLTIYQGGMANITLMDRMVPYCKELKGDLGPRDMANFYVLMAIYCYEVQCAMENKKE